MIKFLQESREQLRDLEAPSLDRFDHFSTFIAAQLRNKPHEVSNYLMKEITNLVLSDMTIEVSFSSEAGQYDSNQ